MGPITYSLNLGVHCKIRHFFSTIVCRINLSVENKFVTGILRDKTMNNKLISIPNNDKQNQTNYRLNYWLKSLKQTNQNSIKLPEVFELTIKNTVIKLWVPV